MSKIMEGAREALAVARGETPAARMTINGHAYVPEASVNPDIRRVTELLEAINRRTSPGSRNFDELLKDMDLACDYARTALNVLRAVNQ